MEEALGVFVQSFLQNLHTAMPARVVSYNAEKQTVDVQPSVKRLIETIEGGELAESLPVIPDVPLAFPRSSKMFLSFPMAEGDLVMLVFQMRSIDRFAAGDGSGEVDPGDFRTHDITDAVAYPGLYPASRAVKDIDTVNLALGNDEGGLQIKITPNGTMEIQVSGDASSAMALGDVLQSWYDSTVKVFLQTHTHPTGVGPSGPPIQPPPDFDASIVSQVVKVKGP